MAGIKIARGTDPFKRYWWVILLAFGAIGGWICLPGLESAGGGSAAPTAEAGLKTADQNLDSADNPSGAPGSAVDMSMPGARKKADGDAVSSLYQAPGDNVAASTAIVPAGTTFADALKDITRASSARASVTAASAKGGWSEPAQRGFAAPKANFGSMSGFGGGSASGASASSAGGGSFSGSGSFGDKGPNTGASFAKGLKDDGSQEPGGPKAIMRSLEKAKAASMNAAAAGSNDVAKAAGGAVFDGNGSGRISGGGGGVGANTGGVYGSLDSAPVNLKANDPNLSKTTITPPPKPTPVPPQPDEMKQMLMQLAMSVAMAGVMAIL